MKCALFFSVCVSYVAYAEMRFAIVSSPTEGKVYYDGLPSFRDLATWWDTSKEIRNPPSVLIDNLKAPHGLAPYLQKSLLVSDCEAQNIYMYDLVVDASNPQLLGVANNFTLVLNIPGGARWLTADDTGNIFYTVEATSEIFKLTREEISKAWRFKTPIATPTVMYQGSSIPQVSAPSGIAVDDFYLYWGNKVGGNSHGSVVAAYRRSEGHFDDASTGYPMSLSTNENKVHGICSMDMLIFYTSSTTLYAVHKKGSEPSIVSTGEMTAPRGCVYDNDGTVYVADRGTNAVYSFPAHLGKVRKAKQLRKVMDVPAPCQIALVSGGAYRTAAAFLWLFFI